MEDIANNIRHRERDAMKNEKAFQNYIF